MKWIKCSEKIPKFGERILCFQPADDSLPDWVYEGYLEDSRESLWEWKAAKNCLCEEDHIRWNPTHWAPLPKGPEEFKVYCMGPIEDCWQIGDACPKKPKRDK